MDSLISSSKFFTQLKNGESFTDNLTDFTYNLAGSIQEKIRTEKSVQVSWTARATLADIIEINGNNLTRQTGDFIADGFTVGDTIDVKEFNVGVMTDKALDRLVTFISPTLIIFDGASEPQDFSENYFVFGKTALHAFRHNYGLIENSEATNYLSKIDNTVQQFYADGVGAGVIGARATTVIPCLTNNQIKSWQNGSCTVQFVSEGYLGVNTTQQRYVQEYEIVHTFDLLPYFRDGEIPNLQGSTPPTDLFASAASLKYVMKSEHSIALSNPNGVKEAIEDGTLGSVGYYDENFNNLNNDYSIDQITYFDTGTAAFVSEINAGSQTEIEVTIDSANASFSATSKFVLCVSYLPSAPDYQPDPSNTVRDPGQFNVAQNFLLATQLNEVGQPITGAGLLTDVEGTFVNAGQITVKGRVQYTATQQQLLDESKFYVVSVIVENDALTNVSSDRVNLISDVREYALDADLAGLMITDNSKFKIIAHNEILTDPGTTDYKGWVEDGFLVSFPFLLNNSQGAIADTIEANFVMFNQATDDVVVIQGYSFDLSQVPVVGGAQQFNIQDDRGFLLEPNSIFDRAWITTRGVTVIGPSTFTEYSMNFAVKANFEDQIALPAAPSSFNNFNDPNNGLNKLSSNYSNVNGYQIKLMIDANVSALSTTTKYRFMTPDLEIREWHLSNIEPAPWLCIIETEDQSGNDLLGNMSDTENTKIKGTFTIQTGLAPTTGLWAYIHLYESAGTIFSQDELSSIQGSRANNRLVPLAAQTQVKITTVGADVFTECEIDYTKINPLKSYYIDARLSTESEELIVDIQTTFIGGASGTWNADIVLQDAGNNPLPNGVQVFLTLKEGFAILGTAEYLVGDTIGVDAPQGTTGIWAGMLPYIPNVLVADGMLLQFAKKDWAIATGNITEVCIDAAIAMIWELQATDGINTSNLASDTMGLEEEESRFDSPLMGCRVDNVIAVQSQFSNGVQTLIDTTTGKTETLATYLQAVASCIDTNTVSNGKVSIMHINYIATTGLHTIRRSEYDGTCWAQTYAQALGFEGAARISEDKLEVVNGKSVIWVGTARGNSPPRNVDRIVLLEWNGASYTETDMTSLTEQIFVNEVANNAFTNISINDIVVDSNQDVYVSVRILLGATANSQLWRLRQTGATYNNPAHWTAKKMAGLGNGDVDGIGSAALFANSRGFDIIGYDGTEGLNSGTNPMFMIADGNPNVKFKRGERNIPTDTYNITTEYGGVSGDLDGIGTAARFTAPKNVISFADQGFMLFVDNTNDKVYKVDLGTQQVTSFAGFQLNSFQNAISF